jgi:signal transduction histidine kinase
VLFSEGDPGEWAYLISEGEFEVLKATEGREVMLAVRGPGEVIGEIALLDDAPRSATVRVRSPGCVLAIGKAHLDELLATSPSAAKVLFGSILQRWKETQSQLRQSERMVQLGTLTSGVAHELNNPAAAVKRAAEQLARALEAQSTALAELAATEPQRVRDALNLAEELAAASRPPLSALARSDAASEVEEWLRSHGVEKPPILAAEAVAAGIRAPDLGRIAVAFTGAEVAVLRLATAIAGVRRIGGEIAEGSGRLSRIVSALKSYSFLDQAPVQDVDLVKGIEDTLLILGHKLTGVEVVREYHPDLPKITAFGSQLNQVWTNLIDNAAEALAETKDGRIVLRAYPEGDMIVVEVEDNGPGIPAEIRPKIFDAFFTTKPPGKGTGLGLSISYRIVVFEHRGELTAASQPGKTVFRASVPIEISQDPKGSG